MSMTLKRKNILGNMHKRSLNQALLFDLSDYDSNNEYISKKKVNLDKEDKEAEINYYYINFEKVIQKIIDKRNHILIDEDKLAFLLGQSIGCKYRLEKGQNDTLRLLVHNFCNIFGWESDLNWIDTSNITNMTELFADTSFNGNIAEWNTSNVTDMSCMFNSNKKFNLPIGRWDVSNVEDMKGMFFDAASFNLPLDNWNVSNVRSMHLMFFGASSFNLNISNWDVSNVKSMMGMFKKAHNFNLPIGNWNVSNVEDMFQMFYYAERFNLPIGDWNINKVETMCSMFLCAYSFNLSLSNWHIKNNVDTDNMFELCKIANKNKPIFLKKISESLNLTINFDLNDYDSDSNNLYIAKRKKDLDREDKDIEIKYYVGKLINGETLSEDSKKLFLTLIKDNYYTIEDDNKNFRALIISYCNLFGWESDLNWIDTSNVTDMSYLLK